MKKTSMPPLPKSPVAQNKFAKVMREGKRGTLHMGQTGKTVPQSRPDIMRAIAASESRRVLQKGGRK